MSLVALGPDTKVKGPRAPVERADRVGHGGDDLRALHEAEMQVGDERQRAPARALAAIEDDRAGLRDGQRAAGQGAVERIEVAHAEPVVLHELEAVGPPALEQPGRHAEAARAVLGAHLRDGLGQGVGLAHGGAVVRHALGEARHRVAAGGGGRLVGLRLDALAGRHVAQGGAHAPEDVRHARSSRHQSLNVCLGTSGSSRERVHGRSAAPASGPRPSLAARWAAS